LTNALHIFTKEQHLEEVLEELGRLHVDLEQYEEALHAFQQILEFKKDDYKMWDNCWRLLREMGKVDEARECVERAMKVGGDADAWINRAGFFAEIGDNENDVICFDEALKLDEQDAKSYEERGMLLSLLNR